MTLREDPGRFAIARDLLKSLRGRRPTRGQLIIADPGLLGNHGHHANHCRYILQAASAQKITVRLLAHADVDASVKAELGAVPFFRAFTYARTNADPICGWLKSFSSASELTRLDLAGLRDITRDDIVFVQGAQAAQLAGTIDWALDLPADRLPRIVVELGAEPGVTATKKSSGVESLVIPTPNIDPRPVLYRFAVRNFELLRGRGFHIATYDSRISELFSRLMGEQVAVLPFPVPAPSGGQVRKGKRPITVAALGHQQVAKGYTLLPDVAERLLKHENDIRLVIHNSDPDLRFVGNSVATMRSAQEKLRSLSAVYSNLILNDSDVGFGEWEELVAAADLMLCPYDPVYYRTKHSGLLATAIANGIPLILPGQTYLSQWLEDFGDCGATFAKHDALSIVGAVRKVLRDYDSYAERAHAASVQWAAVQGPANLLRHMAAMA